MITLFPIFFGNRRPGERTVCKGAAHLPNRAFHETNFCWKKLRKICDLLTKKNKTAGTYYLLCSINSDGRPLHTYKHRGTYKPRYRRGRIRTCPIAKRRVRPPPRGPGAATRVRCRGNRRARDGNQSLGDHGSEVSVRSRRLRLRIRDELRRIGERGRRVLAGRHRGIGGFRLVRRERDRRGSTAAGETEETPSEENEGKESDTGEENDFYGGWCGAIRQCRWPGNGKNFFCRLNLV